ncbi:hypothetical protein SAICODRAFT_32180 [Saitoella complicata NRRL Y-17804]|uniref:Transmembrane protein 186 n=1 Tax=Saitoella complicata (strain BCRC 22490 / CBS 7301 / JCM 7358 / NBRC 10748 / NRRL Y-17804) TaxID=698492 RepID=A0A0E9NIQ5_SAICN|nr:uncharacterized protein SAICODRAFT_32180 [Saitoella complicata NRRL Y-17804]ODQ50063.1 hypothetical protein SAICODRAFT_32180 [Saitoella complicata NRRL Y-17804]GAO49752.1 hypothetical protein G7K_3894-t1 [Saitoella complicata NRRL Y-17804]
MNCTRSALRLHQSLGLRALPLRGSVVSFARFNSTSSPSSPSPKIIEYDSPLRKAVTGLKIFSVGSLGLTAAITPIFIMMESTGAQMVMIGTAFTVSALNTLMVTYLTSPYVIRARTILSPSSSSEGRQIEFTTLSLIGTKKTATFPAKVLMETDEYDSTDSRFLSNVTVQKELKGEYEGVKTDFFVHKDQKGEGIDAIWAAVREEGKVSERLV